MTLLHQAAKQAVEALPRYRWDQDMDVLAGPYPDGEWVRRADVIAALQQQPEPVAWRRRLYDAPSAPWQYRDSKPEPGHADRVKLPYTPLYTASPALQHQEVPREPVADFDTWQQNPYTKVLMDSIKNDYMPRADAEALIRAAASPSTTRQQEVGSGWRPIESAPKDGTWIAAIGHLGQYTPDTLKWKDGHWWNGYDNYHHAPTHWTLLAAAPSTPEKAGGVSDGVGGNDGVTPCSLCASHDLCKQHGCAGKALERERAARGVTPPAATFTGDELVRFYEEWEFNEEDPGEAEFIELVREVERRVLQRTHGVRVPVQLESPEVYLQAAATLRSNPCKANIETVAIMLELVAEAIAGVSASGSHPLPAQANDGGEHG